MKLEDIPVIKRPSKALMEKIEKSEKKTRAWLLRLTLKAENISWEQKH